MRMLASVVGLAGLLVLGSAPLLAAEPPPPADQLILHLGDTITWTPTSPHQLRFGGSVRFNNQPLQLTSFAVVQGILDFNPPAPPPDKDGIVKWPAGTKVTGTVKQTATVGGQFFFTCGFPQHSNVMVTVPFTVATASGAPGNREIKSANGPIRWVLDGKYDLNRQP
jgi:hypothetical protein